MRKTVVFLLLTLTGTIATHSLSLYAQEKPKFAITTIKKADYCPSGGVNYKEGFVKADMPDTEVEITLYLQNYDNTWTKKHFKHKGSGFIQLNLSSCNFTGNYYAYAKYTNVLSMSVPSLQDIKEKHKQLGNHPKFRISKQTKIKDCTSEQDGICFQEGQVFTPNGEAVSITIFMQKQDGSWRKKHFRYVGSGTLPLDIKDCDLNGIYKTRITVESSR
ncbi:hypothetical protein V6R21_31985 [Limibacter armeniacum]|uniref:hypothetical protein n=1 Tax=Limibacter armeniacum TaxID=466084 RepID=UPI002FE55FEA